MNNEMEHEVNSLAKMEWVIVLVSRTSFACWIGKRYTLFIGFHFHRTGCVVSNSNYCALPSSLL